MQTPTETVHFPNLPSLAVFWWKWHGTAEGPGAEKEQCEGSEHTVSTSQRTLPTACFRQRRSSAALAEGWSILGVQSAESLCRKLNAFRFSGEHDWEQNRNSSQEAEKGSGLLDESSSRPSLDFHFLLYKVRPCFFWNSRSYWSESSPSALPPIPESLKCKVQC